MEFILDNPETEKVLQRLLQQIRSLKNGDVVSAMERQGLVYKTNWGVSLPELRELARGLDPDHLLALKLWNKNWRESMILATLLDNPEEVTEEQMDFWTKSFESSEIAEQASANLWVKSRFSFVKALEWCRGKKHLVRFTGIHLAGRLALTQKNVPDEMFKPFFEELAVLGKDSRLYTVIYRTLVVLGTRSAFLNRLVLRLAEKYRLSEQEHTVRLGEALFLSWPEKKKKRLTLFGSLFTISSD